MVLTPDDRGYTYLIRRFNRQVATQPAARQARGVTCNSRSARSSTESGAPVRHADRGRADTSAACGKNNGVMKDLGIDAISRAIPRSAIAGIVRHSAGQVCERAVRTGGRIIDSTRYVQRCAQRSARPLREQSRVLRLRETDAVPVAAGERRNRERGAGRGGDQRLHHHRDANLEGKLRSSGLLSLPGTIRRDTPNAYYFDPHAHYWARQDGKLIAGGEDVPVVGANFHARRRQRLRSAARALVGEHVSAPRGASARVALQRVRRDTRTTCRSSGASRPKPVWYGGATTATPEHVELHRLAAARAMAA